MSESSITHIAIIVIMFIMVSCDNPVEDKYIPPDEVCADTTQIPLLKDWLIPLTPGNYWEYKVESLFDEDTIPLITTYNTHRILENFNALLECNMYETVIYDRGLSAGEQWIYWQDSTGYYSLGGLSENDTLFYKTLITKYPVNVGDQWEIPMVTYNRNSRKFIIHDTTYTYSCTSINEELSTPAGVFNCYVFYHRKSIGDDVIGVYDIYDYLVPHIGLVGQEEFITIEEPGDTITYLYGRATLNNYQLIQ